MCVYDLHSTIATLNKMKIKYPYYCINKTTKQKAQGPHRSPVQTKAMDSFEYKNEFKISRNLSIVYLDFKK